MQNNQPLRVQEVVAIVYPHVVIFTRRYTGDQIIETLRIQSDLGTKKRHAS